MTALEQDLTERLARAKKDREGWFNQCLLRADRIKELEAKLEAMTTARNNAVAAAHLLHEEK